MGVLGHRHSALKEPPSATLIPINASDVTIDDCFYIALSYR
jgi:hypothetical protein